MYNIICNMLHQYVIIIILIKNIILYGCYVVFSVISLRRVEEVFCSLSLPPPPGILNWCKCR